MDTKGSIDLFLIHLEREGRSKSTINSYLSRLRRLAVEFPELPTTTGEIESFLRRRGETPARRGKVFDVLSSFYGFLEEYEGVPSPVPSRGKVGRPQRRPRSEKERRYPAQGSRSALHTNPEVMHNVSAHVPGSGGRDLGNGTPGTSPAAPGPGAILTQDAVDRFVASRVSQGVSPATLAKYKSVFDRFVQQFPLLPTAPETIEDYSRGIKGTADTRWTYLSTIRALYNFLEKRLEVTNPMRQIRIKLPPRKVRPTLELEQLSALIRLELEPWEKAILTLVMDTGLRSGEIINLDRENVYQDHVQVRGKTGERQVPISPETYELLVGIRDHGALFQYRGRRWQERHLQMWTGRLLARVGYTGKKRGLHLIRHSFARHYIAQGGDLMSLKDVLGHTQVKTTQIYADLAFQDVKARHRSASPLRKVMKANHVSEKDQGQGA